MNELTKLTSRMELRPPESPEAIAATEQALAVRLPSEYVEFLLAHNGGEGLVGDHGYARFDPVEDLPANQAELYDFDHLAYWVVFGTNGAGEGYAFDEHGEILVVPWLGGREDAIRQGRFPEFLRRCAAGTMFER